MAIEFAFPISSNPDHRKVVADCIRDALFDHEEAGGFVEDGEHNSAYYCRFTDCA